MEYAVAVGLYVVAVVLILGFLRSVRTAEMRMTTSFLGSRGSDTHLRRIRSGKSKLSKRLAKSVIRRQRPHAFA